MVRSARDGVGSLAAGLRHLGLPQLLPAGLHVRHAGAARGPAPALESPRVRRNALPGDAPARRALPAEDPGVRALPPRSGDEDFSRRALRAADRRLPALRPRSGDQRPRRARRWGVPRLQQQRLDGRPPSVSNRESRLGSADVLARGSDREDAAPRVGRSARHHGRAPTAGRVPRVHVACGAAPRRAGDRDVDDRCVAEAAMARVAVARPGIRARRAARRAPAGALRRARRRVPAQRRCGGLGPAANRGAERPRRVAPARESRLVAVRRLGPLLDRRAPVATQRAGARERRFDPFDGVARLAAAAQAADPLRNPSRAHVAAHRAALDCMARRARCRCVRPALGLGRARSFQRVDRRPAGGALVCALRPGSRGRADSGGRLARRPARDPFGCHRPAAREGVRRAGGLADRRQCVARPSRTAPRLAGVRGSHARRARADRRVPDPCRGQSLPALRAGGPPRHPASRVGAAGRGTRLLDRGPALGLHPLRPGREPLRDRVQLPSESFSRAAAEARLRRLLLQFGLERLRVGRGLPRRARRRVRRRAVARRAGAARSELGASPAESPIRCAAAQSRAPGPRLDRLRRERRARASRRLSIACSRRISTRAAR